MKTQDRDGTLTYKDLPDTLYVVELDTNFEMLKSWNKKDVEPRLRAYLKCIKWLPENGQFSVWRERDHYFSGFSSIDAAIKEAEESIKRREEGIQDIKTRLKNLKDSLKEI